MNTYLIQRLKSCDSIQIPDNINEITSFIIPKKVPLSVKIGGCYNVQFDRQKLNNTHQFFSSVQDIEVQDIKGNEIKIFSPLWEGWIPLECLFIIKEY